MDNVVLKISSKSNPSKVAGAIVNMLGENEKVELNAIGAGAVNQAAKSIAIARGYIAPNGKNLICIPAFTTMNIEEYDTTGIKFIVKKEK
jgi:stage V sporulation protein S